jgi:hypothetical protein
MKIYWDNESFVTAVTAVRDRRLWWCTTVGRTIMALEKKNVTIYSPNSRQTIDAFHEGWKVQGR